MSEPALLPEMIRCPRCAGALGPGAGGGIACASCAQLYPVFAGLPWLYRDVAGSRSQWASKLQSLGSEIKGELADLGAAAARPDLLAATRLRLERLCAGTERLGRQLFELLAPFAFAHSEAGASLPVDRIPSRQHFGSYLETVFRDWCWGEDEIQTTLGLIDPLLDGDAKGRDVLVLGGGAGRLAYELARHGRWKNVVQLDINPLLTRIAALLAAGESLTLTEIPRMPMGLDHVAVDQTLSRPGEGAVAPLHFLIGDAFAPPFASEAFEVLITPWLLDILPESFDRVARRLNAWLAPGASWISFGPLSFESLPAHARFTREEMEEALEAAGLEVVTSELRRVPYLHSPHGMPRRGEEILLFRAIRRESAPIEESFSFYPPWMTDATQSVPALPIFEQMRNDRVLDLEILGLIDGRVSIGEIVERLAVKYDLPRDRCRNAVQRFFSKLYEVEGGFGGESRGRPG